MGVKFCFDCAEISSKLDSAESRCNVLEKQLEYMRRMVHSAESDRSQALRHTAQLQRQQVETEALEVQAQLDKIKDLEREHLKLSASQTLAEVAASSNIYICFCAWSFSHLLSLLQSIYFHNSCMSCSE